MKHWTLSKSQLMFPKLGYLQTSLGVCTGHAQVVLVKQTIDRETEFTHQGPED